MGSCIKREGLRNLFPLHETIGVNIAYFRKVIRVERGGTGVSTSMQSGAKKH